MCRAYHNARHEGCNACIRHGGGAAPRAMTFSDSDWTREPPHARRTQAKRRTAVLTALIALACLALAIGWYGIEQILDARARSRALREVSAAQPHAVAPAAPTASLVAPGLPATAPAVTPSAPAAAASASDAQAMAALEAEMRQRAREAAQQAAVDAVRRKERAWERWYQRPTFCNENPTSAQMVECANHHIRARKEFEERYAAGRL
jgi:hypothetical protein